MTDRAEEIRARSDEMRDYALTPAEEALAADIRWLLEERERLRASLRGLLAEWRRMRAGLEGYALDQLDDCISDLDTALSGTPETEARDG